VVELTALQRYFRWINGGLLHRRRGGVKRLATGLICTYVYKAKNTNKTYTITKVDTSTLIAVWWPVMNCYEEQTVKICTMLKVTSVKN